MKCMSKCIWLGFVYSNSSYTVSCVIAPSTSRYSPVHCKKWLRIQNVVIQLLTFICVHGISLLIRLSMGMCNLLTSKVLDGTFCSIRTSPFLYKWERDVLDWRWLDQHRYLYLKSSQLLIDYFTPIKNCESYSWSIPLSTWGRC